jgi:hypothetical protein
MIKVYLRRLRWLTAAVCVSLLLIGAASAQTRLASIEGRVVDETGAALPGVTVTIASPALQVAQLVSVSGPDGTYRLTDLPIGTYRVSFELAGFRSHVREGVVLAPGFVGRVDGDLKVGALEETVTVSGQSPVVDVVTTRGGSTISADLIQTIPNSRNYQDILNMTSGVSVAAPPQMGEIGFRALTGGIKTYGLTGQTQTQVEGLQMSESAFPDFATAEQVDVKTFGNTADVAQPGALTDVIVKSGSNSFHGRYHEQYMNKSLQSANLDDALRAQGLRSGDGLRFYQDFAGDLGGRLVRDKVWFYGAFRDVRNERTLTGYSRTAGPDRVYGTADDEPGYPPALQQNQTVKVSSQLTPKNRLIGFWQRNWVDEKQAQGSRFVPFEGSREVQWEPIQYKVELQSTPSNRFFYNLTYGRTSERIFYVPNSPTTPARYDLRTGIQTGEYASATNFIAGDIYGSQSKRHIINATLSAYPGKFLGGSHEFRVGVRGWLENRLGNFFDRTAGNYRLIYDAGKPTQIMTYDNPTTGRDGLNEYSSYLMDQWRPVSNVTLNLGIRWEKIRTFTPEQSKSPSTFGSAATFAAEDIARWNAVAPRAAVAWDLGGNGKSVVKGTYGWYNYRIAAAAFTSVFNKARTQASTYRWTDQDGNNDYTPGEVNLSFTGPDFITTTGGNTNVANLDLKQPHTHEITASFEREVAREASVRVLYVFRKTANDWEAVNPRRAYGVYNVPITRRDPGPDGRVGTADDTGSVTFYDFDPALRTAVALQYQTRVNADHFNTAEITFTKRRSDRWSVVTGLSMTKNYRWVDAIAENPNELFFPIDTTTEWSYKLAGTYLLAWKVETSALFDAYSGAPGQRTYLFGAADPDGGPALRGFGTVNLRLEPFGSRRGPTRNNLNLRVARSLDLARGQKVRLELDALNALNTNVPWGNPGAGTPALGIIFASGPTFGFAQQIVAPRIFRLGVTYSF